MPTSIEVTGASVEEAIQKGLEQLGVGPSQVIVEVIDEPSRGLFGFGSRLAKVRLQLLAPAAPPPRKPEPAAPQRKPEAANPPAAQRKPEAANPQRKAEPVTPAKPSLEAAPPAATAEKSAEQPPRRVAQGERAQEPERKGRNRNRNRNKNQDRNARPPQGAEPAARPPQVTALPAAPANFDDDDFFDEDGTYGTGDVDLYTPAIERQDRQDRRAPYDSYGVTDDDIAEASEVVSPPPTGAPRRGGEGKDRRDSGGRPNNRNNNRTPRNEPRALPVAEGEEAILEAPAGEAIPLPPLGFAEGAKDPEIAAQILREILAIMQFNAEVETYQPEPNEQDTSEDGPPHIINIVGHDNLDDLIGRRGETLSALQYLTRLIISKQTASRANIMVDVESYRHRRIDRLEQLATRMADQAVETNRTVTMEPMPPHERRIIHMVLRHRDDVETESKGQGDERRVTIIPKRKPIR